ncbi:MAG: tetratricopeptide repeat protein [Methanosarcina flavescens]
MGSDIIGIFGQLIQEESGRQNRRGMVCAWGQRNRSRKKIEYFDKVLKLKPDFAGVWNLKGLEFVVLKRYEEAIASFNKALEIRPSYPEARYNKEDAETELRKIRASKAKAEEKEETTVERTEV